MTFNIPSITPDFNLAKNNPPTQSRIVRRCDRRDNTPTFVERIRKTASVQWFAPQDMIFLCHKETGDIVPRVDGRFLPRAQFAELVEALQSFYANITDEEIAVYNAQSDVKENINVEKQPAHTIQWTKNWPRKAGHAYVIRKPGDTLYKIGFSKNVQSRMKQLGLDYKPEIVHLVSSDHAFFAEQFLHCCMNEWRVEGEWFALPSQAVEWIKSISTLNYPDGDSETDAVVDLYQTSFCTEVAK